MSHLGATPAAPPFERLLELSPDVLFRLEVLSALRLSYISAACEHLLGYTPEELSGDADLLFAVIHPEDRPGAQARMTERMARPPSAPLVLTFRCAHKSGHTIWVEMTYVPVVNDAGGLAAVEGIVRDITKRVQQEAEVREHAAREQRRREQAEQLAATLAAVSAATTLEQAAEAALRGAITLLGGVHGALWLYDLAGDATLATLPATTRVGVRMTEREGVLQVLEVRRTPDPSLPG